MPWKLLADTVTGMHLTLMAFFAVSAILLAAGAFKAHLKWKIFFWVFIGAAVGLQFLLFTKVWKSCPVTDLEYWLRSHYDTTGSYVRTRSLLGTAIYNVTGTCVPEFYLTALLVVGIIVMVLSLVFWKPCHIRSEPQNVEAPFES